MGLLILTLREFEPLSTDEKDIDLSDYTVFYLFILDPEL